MLKHLCRSSLIRILPLVLILMMTLALVGFAPTQVAAAGTTYYVDNTNPACTDTGTGAGTLAKPYCTIVKGASQALPGDTVRVLHGTYAETIFPPQSGTEGQPITYKADPGVTMTGNAAGFGSAFGISGKSYIVIDGFTFTQTKNHGFYATGSNHLTIINNHISLAGDHTLYPDVHSKGIYLSGTTYSLISGNTVDYNTCVGIFLTNGSDYNTITNNASFGNASVIVADAAGIALYGSSHNTISKNMLYGNEDSGISIYGDDVTGVSSSYNLVVENLAYGNGDHGIDNNDAPYNTVVGNTIQGNGTVGINFEGSTTGSHHAIVANNIMMGNGLTPPTGAFKGNLRVDPLSIEGTTLDYDLFQLQGADRQILWNGVRYNSVAEFKAAVSGQEVHGLQGDPLFVNPVAPILRTDERPYTIPVVVGDYHLSAGSPAIDSANSGAPGQLDTDIEGNARRDDPFTVNSGAGSRTYDDRGALEFQPVELRYDDTDPAWSYSGTWSTYSGNGPYNNTLHQTNTAGSYAQVTFSGVQVKLIYLKAPARGTIDVYIDGTKVTSLNANSPTLVWQASWTSPALSAGTHTIRFVNASGGWIDLDALQTYGALTPVTAGTYDDADSAWSYSGPWSTYSGSGPYNNTLHQSNTTGAYAEVVFDGIRIKLTYLKAPGRGSIDVYIDGTKVNTIDANAALTWQASWTSGMLTAGTHTVRFVNASTSWIDLDALQVYAALTPVGAGTYDDAASAWNYSGTWSTYSGSGPYSNTLHQSNVLGSAAEVTFNGVQVKLIYLKAPGRGSIDVYLDGTKVDTINANGTLTWQASWTSGVLAAGTHTVRFQNASTSWIDLDAIQVFEADSTAPAAITSLGAVSGTGNGVVNLSWTAVGDDGTTGTATSYLVRYSTSAISSLSDWNNATVVNSGIPTPQAAGQAESMTVSGLNAGQTYYFAVRAQDEQGNLGGVSNSPSAVASTAPAVGAGTYDDGDPAWSYSGVWTAYTGAGPYNNSLHQSSTAGSYAEVRFDGVQIKLSYLKAPGRGSIDVYIDGTKVNTINANGTLTWQASWVSGMLAAGTHTVRFQNAVGGWIDLDAIQVYAAVTPVGTGTYDDTDSAWTYTGVWTTYSGSGPYNNSLHQTSTAGAYAEVTFSGTQVTLKYLQVTGRGSIDVYIDGTKVDTINANSPSLVWQASWTSGTLTAGTHTVRFQNAVGGWIDLDALTVQ